MSITLTISKNHVNIFFVLKEFFASLLDLIYPRNCLVCHKFLAKINPATPVCETCWDKIEKNLPPFCSKCGRHIEENASVCSTCQKRDYNFTQGFSVTNYSGTMRNLIHLFKFKNKVSLVKPFAKLMAEFFEIYNLARFKFDYLVAVPLHPTRLREREYNQAELLTKETAKLLSLNFSLDNLKRIKHTLPQSALKEHQRLDNVAGAFTLKNPKEFFQKNILLIDDLLTTGATCSEASYVLKQASHRPVYVLSLATTP